MEEELPTFLVKGGVVVPNIKSRKQYIHEQSKNVIKPLLLDPLAITKDISLHILSFLKLYDIVLISQVNHLRIVLNFLGIQIVARYSCRWVRLAL